MTTTKYYDLSLTRLLNEIPDKRQRVSYEEAMEMRRVLTIGMLEASRFLRKCSSVSEAIDLYHKIKRRLVEMEEKIMKQAIDSYSEDLLDVFL